MIKSGYDYVHRGGGRDTYFIQFGKHLSEVEYDKYGSERYVDDFMIENGDMKVYRTDE